jgi:hypothetical protein
MSALTHRTSRAVWGWCVVYTALTPAPARCRRREEMRSHLWESERAHLPGWAVVLAAVRGAVHDISWVAARGLPSLGRSFGTPTPYVVLAPLFPIQGWIVSATTVGAVVRLSEAIGSIGGGAMLLLAGLVWVIRKPGS